MVNPSPAPDIVSVVIPAYNAQQTLDATLTSVRSQTYRGLEIVVVNDGSTDGTVQVAERHAGRDARIRLVSQRNSGVAAARNRAIGMTSGKYIAPVDADDVWAVTKIERQVAEIQRCGNNVGLVYTWVSLIDDHGLIIYNEIKKEIGNCLAAMCYQNLVGNGSAPLMLRTAVEQAGGYDEELRAMGAEGCEDYKLYLGIAEKYEFSLVPEFLTGYRMSAGAMSSDPRRMLASRDLCLDQIVRRHPALAGDVRRGRGLRLRSMLHRSVSERQARSALFVTGEMFRHDSARAVADISSMLGKAGVRAFRRLERSFKGAPRVPDLFPMGDLNDIDAPKF